MRNHRAARRRRRPQNRIAAVAAVAVAAVFGLAACGEKSEEGGGPPQPFALALDARPGPDHAGLYMARKLGYFREAGLAVSIQAPSPGGVTATERLAGGGADLAIARGPDLPLAHERGGEEVAVAALVDTPLASLVWLRRSGVDGVGGLRGRRIAMSDAPLEGAFLRTALAGANLSPADVRTVPPGRGLAAALLGGRAAASLGGFRNLEGPELRLRGRRPVVTPVDELGVPAYDELVLLARRGELDADPKPVRLFLAALARGTAAAAERPAAAAQALLEANPALEPRLARAQVRATLPLLAPDRPDRPYGYMDPARWRQLVGWMRDSGLISPLPAPSSLLTNEYLPGEIPG